MYENGNELLKFLLTVKISVILNKMIYFKLSEYDRDGIKRRIPEDSKGGGRSRSSAAENI